MWAALAKPRRTYDLIVDALFGTGVSRPLEGLFLQVVQHLSLTRAARDNFAKVRPLILSIDLPSGLNADLARPFGEAVAADLTVTFSAPKPANVLPPASQLNGKLVVANIGQPASLDRPREALSVRYRSGRRTRVAHQDALSHLIPSKIHMATRL